MFMQTASRIERCRAGGAGGLTLKVFRDAQLITAGAAQHCLFIEALCRPYFWAPASRRLVTVKAGIVLAAAIKFNGDSVNLGMIMTASCFFVHIKPFNRNLVAHE